MSTAPTPLPPVAPEVLAEAVESLTARLRKKLDAAIEGCAAGTPAAEHADDGSIGFRFGEDAVVTLRPGPGGAVTDAGQAVCSCLLAPRCLHRAAVLGAAPLADAAQPEPEPEPEAGDGASESGDGDESEPSADPASQPAAAARAGVAAQQTVREDAAPAEAALTPAQTAAASALWQAAAEALAAGVTAGGAVVQAELLRAAHTARLAGLPRAEAATLRLVRGLRAARERSGTHRLADLTAAFRELLHTAAALASGAADPALAGSVRRAYRPGGSLRVHGLCREPVLSATGYGGVVTHLLAPDGGRYSVSDVRPGGLARAKGAGSASVALGGAVLDHAGLARGGLRIAGATVSPDGRLGAGRGVQATPLPGVRWTGEPAAALFARPAAEAVAAQLTGPDPDAAGPALLGCDVTVVGAAGEDLLVREIRTGQAPAPLLRLRAAHPHPE
ncbi:SWIM zinc finger family protein, partial [Streptomyces sp. BR123]|uniref:SWIM zinc finger family protein n=1 Tax=Streptomyces sp. BR123 TaxID=2749828 RepID=UPI0015C4D465